MPKDSNQKVNNLLLIGAGFTKAVFPDAPLNEDLLRVLCKGASCNVLKKYRRKYKTDDIEILLTHLDLEILQPKAKRQTALQTVRKTIGQQLAECFRQFRFGNQEIGNNNWLEPFAQKVFHQNDVIVSLNYDCFLEGLLDQHEVWCPSTGYGAVKVDVPGASFNKQINPKNILIYKIHGSENFHTTSLALKDINPRRISLVVNNGKIYPKSGKSSNVGVVEGKPYIIAPSFVKFFLPQIQLMMNEALQTAAQAKHFVVIGCSLRPEDNHLWLLLTNFIYNSKNVRKIIVVDYQADTIKSKICDYYFLGDDSTIKIEAIWQKDGLNRNTVDELINNLG